MRKFVVLLCIAAGFSHSVFAQSNNPLDQLKAGDFKSLEGRYSVLQSQFERGVASEYDLLDAYKVFYLRDNVLEPQLNEWVERFKSSSAHLARGIYFRKRGEFARGTDYISRVPDEDVQFMEQMFELAKKDLKTSLRLNAKSYLAIVHLINIAQFQGDDRAARECLALGNATLPNNFLIRARYLIHLAPKWGGSYKMMDKFIETSRSEGLPPEKIQMLTAIELDDQGHSAREQGQSELARSTYAKALTLAIPAGSRFRRDYLQYSLQICAEPQTGTAIYCR
jgi:tetratricopeptide (TPR) repeat protein